MIEKVTMKFLEVGERVIFEMIELQLVHHAMQPEQGHARHRNI